MIKRIFSFLLVFMFFFLAAAPLLASEKEIDVHLFGAEGCPHCKKERAFLETLKEKYPQIRVRYYEVAGNQENIDLLKKVGGRLGADVSGVPFTVIGEKYVSGFYNEETTGQEIVEAIECAVNNGCEDVVESLLEPKAVKEKISVPEVLKVPVLGELETKSLSLPALTFVIALLDGFNPCAMWVLLFLISLLLGMKDRKKMWILGSAFIAASALVYFLFLSAWLNLFLFLGFVFWVRLLIGGVSLAVGGYQVRDFWINKDGKCPVTGGKKRRRIFDRLREITQKKEFLIALGGIVVLAFAVNLVELVCSAGLPAIYTQVLALNRLPGWQYYLYLIFYILVFMLDDLIVFFVAMTTLKAIGLEGKYARYSHLIGGSIVVLIGLLMLFKPELLMFG